MIVAIDVHYFHDSTAIAGAVVFSDYSDSVGYRTYIKKISGTEDYIPGQFYKRELPCILEILGVIREDIETIIIDGYVDLGMEPGLGRHLWNALNCSKNVIGVAKKYFKESDAIKVFRGKSRQPLYITAAGLEPAIAADLIASMHGRFRLPTLIKQADSLSRSLVIH